MIRAFADAAAKQGIERITVIWEPGPESTGGRVLTGLVVAVCPFDASDPLVA